MMSDDTRDGDWFPLTTAARSRGGGSGCCGWLQFMSQGTEPVPPPISEHLRTVVPDRKGGVRGVCQDCVHSAGNSWSSAGDRVTASLSYR